MKRILYISYDGITDSLGQSQVLPYIKELAKHGFQFTVLSFEKKERFKKEQNIIKEVMDGANIRWVPLPYTKKPPILSTVYDIFKGYRASILLHKKYNFHIVHCRGYISSILGRKLKKKYGVKFIFDMRGWWADEKKESGFWNKRIYQGIYKYFKKLERKFFEECDYVVSLTYVGKEEIVKQNLAETEKVGVIPTCVDFGVFKSPDSDFKKKMRKKLGIFDDNKVFVYSGSIEGNYDLEMIIKVFKCFEKYFPQSHLLILAKDFFDKSIKQKFLSRGIHRIAIYNSPFTEVTNYLRSGDVGFIYYKKSFSTIGRSPTKLGEYWASGIPVVAFQGIGDLDSIFHKYLDGGILLSEDQNGWDKKIAHLKFVDPLILRKYSSEYFHIDNGVKCYKNIYDLLVKN